MLGVWTAFIGFVLLMLALDLGVFHRHARVVTVREALSWSAVWIALGLAFTLFVYAGYEGRWFGLGGTPDAVDGMLNDGRSAAIKYLTGYVIEKSLSVDNVFVIAMLFGFFGIPAMYQHRVLFWGILGALVLRGVMIAAGASLIARFHWVLYLFGVFLLLTGLKMLFMKTEEVDPDRNPVVRLARRLFPVTSRFHGERFLVRDGPRGTLMMTPLALGLVTVETTDLIFAVDSIPAIFAITADPFLVFTSNVFAILGLRSLYFALAGMLSRFRYLKASLALVLILVGVKMLSAEWLKQIVGQAFNYWVLGLVLLILAAGAAASWLAPARDR